MTFNNQFQLIYSQADGSHFLFNRIALLKCNSPTKINGSVEIMIYRCAYDADDWVE